MQWLRNLLMLTLLPTCIAAAPGSKSGSKIQAAKKVVNVSAAIQNYEHQLSTVEHDLEQASNEERALLAELDHYNQRLMETIHYLRHATQYSPLLAMLSASKPQDVIHSSMLLRAITPEINYRNQQLLEKVTALSLVRNELEKKQNKLRDITFHYHQERETLDKLLKDRPANNHTREQDLSTDQDEFTLIPPVVGKIIPTYESRKPEWASFTQGILFITRPGAQVISPLSGTIALAKNYTEGQGKMVIIQTAKSHVVMSGLETLSCTLGQSITAGEPLGRMHKQRKGTKTPPKLYLEIWHEEQTVNPKSVLIDNRRTS